MADSIPGVKHDEPVIMVALPLLAGADADELASLLAREAYTLESADEGAASMVTGWTSREHIGYRSIMGYEAAVFVYRGGTPTEQGQAMLDGNSTPSEYDYQLGPFRPVTP